MKLKKQLRLLLSLLAMSVFLLTERRKILVYPVHANIYIFHAELAADSKLPV